MHNCMPHGVIYSKHHHWKLDCLLRCTAYWTYWLEVWGPHLWSAVSTSAHQRHCWEGKTSLGFLGQSLTQLWTTSCPHWDVSGVRNSLVIIYLYILSHNTIVMFTLPAEVSQNSFFFTQISFLWSDQIKFFSFYIILAWVVIDLIHIWLCDHCKNAQITIHVFFLNISILCSGSCHFRHHSVSAPHCPVK